MSDNRLRQYLILALAVAAAIATIGIPGCGYGKVSDKAYKFATSLHSICDRQDMERLNKITVMINKAKTDGELSEREAGWLIDMVNRAKSRDWSTAKIYARQMLSEQVENGP